MSSSPAPQSGLDRAAAVVSALATAFHRASPWRRRGVLFLAGALSIVSLAPFQIWPILWLTLPVLYLGVTADTGPPSRSSRWRFWQGSRAGRAAEAAWWFGFGFHVVGLIWIAEAFLVEAEVFAWLIPVAITGLPGGLALFFAATGAATSRAFKAPIFSRVAAFAVALAVAEWLRGHILTGLPWNIFGYALTGPDALMQSAGLVGIYGLTLIVGVIFVWPVAALLDAHETGRSWLHALRVPVAFAIATLVSLYGYGLMRLARPPGGSGAPVMVRVVQPSVVQREKWRPENQRAIFDLHKSLSVRAASASEHELVVWPEAAMPFFPLDQPVALDEIGALLDERQILVSGALRRERNDAPGRRDKVYNSIVAFQRGTPAKVVGTYDKIHLVPFGEYLPFQFALERIGLEQLSRLRGGFASAPWPRAAMSLPGIGSTLPLICYEAIFPGAVFAGAERPRVLLNVTNDGWFGDTIGPRQHFHQARVRAVEEGVPMIRAANNGISAVFDGAGRVMARLEMNERGAFAVRLPELSAATSYSKYGDKIFFSMTFMLLFFAFAAAKGRPATR